MNEWLSAGYTAFFVLLGAYVFRLGLLERRLRRERQRLGEAATPKEGR